MNSWATVKSLKADISSVSPSSFDDFQKGTFSSLVDTYSSRTGADTYSSRTGADTYSSRTGTDTYSSRTGADTYSSRTGHSHLCSV